VRLEALWGVMQLACPECAAASGVELKLVHFRYSPSDSYQVPVAAQHPGAGLGAGSKSTSAGSIGTGFSAGSKSSWLFSSKPCSSTTLGTWGCPVVHSNSDSDSNGNGNSAAKSTAGETRSWRWDDDAQLIVNGSEISCVASAKKVFGSGLILELDITNNSPCALTSMELHLEFEEGFEGLEGPPTVQIEGYGLLQGKLRPVVAEAVGVAGQAAGMELKATLVKHLVSGQRYRFAAAKVQPAVLPARAYVDFAIGK
jgi:hypothetical protein